MFPDSDRRNGKFKKVSVWVSHILVSLIFKKGKLTDICSGGTSVIRFWRFLTALVAAICQNFVNFENRNGREMKGSPTEFDFGDRV